ncbi:hypothetical protein ACKGJY_00075 [Hyunsoonleella sp. 2307UL5-6]|uniref:hypothetical protein n=1 Tax=Hyunsoonleella sp. 2307UL5-6 TaxID=3384768 RepID=UPI0039BD5985
MKKLEFNQMEKVQGGQEVNTCAFATSLAVIVLVAGAFTGGLGWLIGGAGAYAMVEEGC